MPRCLDKCHRHVFATNPSQQGLKLATARYRVESAVFATNPSQQGLKPVDVTIAMSRLRD